MSRLPGKFKSLAGWIALIVCAIVGMQNCDNVKLSLSQKPIIAAAVPPAGINQQVCTTIPSVNKAATKIMFLIDESGSNIAGNPPTDPGKVYRLGVISNFIASHVNNTSLYYSFVLFNGVSTRGLATPNPAVPGFTNDPTQILAAEAAFKADTEQDGTPYKAAFTIAEAGIAADYANVDPTVATNYVVVILTDGYPTDYGTPVNETAIDSDVTALVTTAPNTTFSTVYYGPETAAADKAAAARLQRIAGVGGGQFLDANLGRNIPLDSLIKIPAVVPWAIKRFVIYNMNSAPCDDGTMDVDSDADGICDKDEIAYNKLWLSDPNYAQFQSRMGTGAFDPLNRNSFSPIITT